MAHCPSKWRDHKVHKGKGGRCYVTLSNGRARPVRKVG